MKTCFLSIDVVKRENQEIDPFEGVKKLDNILDIFRKYRAKATLFVTGEVLEHQPDLVKKWAEEFEMGCHDYYHVSLDKVDMLGTEKQIKDFIDLYKNILNRMPKGFRAPRNIINNEHFEILERHEFLYDSSVLPRYPLGLRHYAGYRGRAPIKPYYPSNEDYRKETCPVKSGEAGSPSVKFNGVKIFEIPEAPVFFNIPLVGTWLRKLGVKFFKFLFCFKKPDFISLSMHSWDGVKFEGKSSRNSGPIYLQQLDEIMAFLIKIGYEFKSGEEIHRDANPQI
jgi:peptidoglycan/xylan/chitin deacetylase (PgdA/CDA1 family)